MGGVTFRDNVFRCRYVGQIVTSYYETANQREGMLACREGYFMTGLHANNSVLHCSRNGNSVSSPSVVSGPANNAITDCSGSTDLTAVVLVGYRHDFARMLCAAVRRGE
jgi:hypothetical protein